MSVSQQSMAVEKDVVSENSQIPRKRRGRPPKKRQTQPATQEATSNPLPPSPPPPRPSRTCPRNAHFVPEIATSSSRASLHADGVSLSKAINICTDFQALLSLLYADDAFASTATAQKYLGHLEAAQERLDLHHRVMSKEMDPFGVNLSVDQLADCFMEECTLEQCNRKPIERVQNQEWPHSQQIQETPDSVEMAVESVPETNELLNDNIHQVAKESLNTLVADSVEQLETEPSSNSQQTDSPASESILAQPKESQNAQAEPVATQQVPFNPEPKPVYPNLPNVKQELKSDHHLTVVVARSIPEQSPVNRQSAPVIIKAEDTQTEGQVIRLVGLVYRCLASDCPATFTSLATRTEHLSQHERLFKCGHCTLHYLSRESLQEHFRQIQKSSKQ